MTCSFIIHVSIGTIYDYGNNFSLIYRWHIINVLPKYNHIYNYIKNFNKNIF